MLPGFNTETPTRVQLVSISYVHVLFTNQSNEARLRAGTASPKDFSRKMQSFEPSSVGLACRDDDAADCTVRVTQSGLPIILVTGFSQLGALHSTPRHRVDTN